MKILVFGLPGSGKSTFCNKLSKKLHIPVFHIDHHFFEKKWVERDHDAFLQDVEKELEKDDWIIDGNAMRTLEMRFKEADIAILCVLPRWLCLKRVFTRQDRPSWKLIKYLFQFKKRYGSKIEELRQKHPHVKFIKVESKKDMELLLGLSFLNN